MMEQFSDVLNCIKKRVIDIKVTFQFFDTDFDLLFEIILALQPNKVAVEYAADANFYTVNITLKFMLNELSS
jgi:hypothetical protein